MKKILDATPTVLEIKDLHFEGNVIPHNWYAHIKNKSGASDLLAITLLSEIVYWYRLMPVYDKEKDILLGYKKKFNKDKLQKQTKELAEKFGFSEQSTNNALKRLVKLGLITREFRDITLQNGIVIQKRQFIDIVPNAIKAITTIQERCTTKLHTLHKKVVEGVQESYPYTCITSETTNKETNTGDVLLKKSDNANTENQTTLKERETNPNTPQVAPSLPSFPNKEKEKEGQSSVKTSETRRKSTNSAKGKYSYQNEIESVLKRFNLICGKSRSATDAITKKIVSFLEYIQKTEKVEKEKAVSIACDYLEFRADEHDFRPKGYIKKKDYTISSLLTKPKYDRYVEMREEQKETKKVISKKNTGFF